MPTLLGLIGTPMPDLVEGQDLSRIVRGNALPGDPGTAEEGFALLQYEHTYYLPKPEETWRAIMKGDWIYTCFLLDGPSQLHNLTRDPYQLENLIDNPEYREKRLELRGTLERKLEEIGDDFFRRRVAPGIAGGAGGRTPP